MRPSGIRQRIADVLGTHKSFVSLITNPGDPTPIPARHLSRHRRGLPSVGPERAAFLAAYAAAHPEQSRRLGLIAAEPHPTKIMHLEVPHLADPERQQELESLIREFTQRLGRLVRET